MVFVCVRILLRRRLPCGLPVGGAPDGRHGLLPLPHGPGLPEHGRGRVEHGLLRLLAEGLPPGLAVAAGGRGVLGAVKEAAIVVVTASAAAVHHHHGQAVGDVGGRRVVVAVGLMLDLRIGVAVLRLHRRGR